MKKLYENTFVRSSLTVILIIMVCCVKLTGQTNTFQLKSIRDVISNWPGWLDSPDTVRIHLDSTFTDAEKDSAKVAAARWNASGGKPALKVVDTPPAEINVTTDNSLGEGTQGQTGYTQDPNNGMMVTGTSVSINDRSGPAFSDIGLTEVLTHEFGHCLGLDETNDSTDCMKAHWSNGKGGQLSKHDSSEIAASAKIWEKLNLRRGVDDPGIIMPGNTALCSFDMGQTYPDSVAATANISIQPLRDPYATILNAVIHNNLLQVTVNIAAGHWLGQFFLDADIHFPSYIYPEVHFLGWEYVNPVPVPHTSFTCPFDVTYPDGLVHVEWANSCTYPYPGALRSKLTVDENSTFFSKGSDTYTLRLSPGSHTLTLTVDDFQGNVATSTQTITVSGIHDGNLTPSAVIYPNPFPRSCKIDCDTRSTIVIFAMDGSQVDQLAPGSKSWTPPAGLSKGIYIMRIRTGEKTTFLKMVYL